MAEEEEPETTDLAGSCWNSARQPWLQVVLVESLTFLAPDLPPGHPFPSTFPLPDQPPHTPQPICCCI